MEVLVVAAIMLAGYGMSRDGRGAQARAAEARTTATQAGDDDTRQFDRDYEQRAAARWQAARDPAVSGIVTGLPTGPAPPQSTLVNAATTDPGLAGVMDRLPFFTSARKQHTSDSVKQTLLETFTGATGMASSQTGVYRNKREVEALFSPSLSAARLTSSGTAGNPMIEQPVARFEPGVLHNNVLPAEQQRVGRGVGVGPDVKAADGFHPMHRVLMDNVNEYRKNQLPGGIIPGSYMSFGQRAAPGDVTASTLSGALVYTQDDRPMLPSEAAVKAHRVYPEQPDLLAPNKPMAHDRFGTPVYFGPGPDRARAEETRAAYARGADNPDRNHSRPLINPTGATHGVGGFTHARFDARCQQREARGRGGWLAGPRSRLAPTHRVARTTQRALTEPAPFGVGGLGYTYSGGRPRAFDAPRPTHRQAPHQQAAPLLGTRAAVQGGMLDNVWRYGRLDRQTARAGQLRAHTPGPGRVNVVLPEARGRMALKNATLHAAGPGLPAVPPSQVSVHDASTVGAQTSTFNKLPSQNQRVHDLGVAVSQLQSNPYAQSLWTQ